MDTIYGWPVKELDLEGFSQLESPVHRQVEKLKFAVDFMVPLNTPVLAMREGEVSYIKNDSTRGGNDLQDSKPVEDSIFYYLGNRVEIHHGNQEYSAYEHLDHESNRVQIGDNVKKGSIIATTGYTGLMAHLGPHLHVERFKWFGPKDEDYKTLKIQWENEEELFAHFFWGREKWKEIGNSRELKRD